MARGRDATGVLQMPWIAWRDILVRFYRAVLKDNVMLIAAGVAFFGLLALFPAITALLAIGGLIADPLTLSREIQSLTSALPSSAADIISTQVNDVASAQSDDLGFTAIVSILLALFSASRGVNNVIIGLNTCYNEEEKRGLIHLQLVVIALTLGLLVIAVLTLAILAALPVALAIFDPAPWLRDGLLLIRWPILYALGVVSFMGLYRFGPSRSPAKWRWLAPGALVACLLWVIATLGFSVYARNFGNYNETFGALGGVIVLLMWLWITAVILLFGAELDGEIEAQTARDSTSGPAKPMGERGAVKADELGEATT
ncbi:YihY/virulence factor BrkB family protein [Pseudoruegeria sp. SK021]|uniref:YihY/virulence factor BrkB family protein n=1 Tax=Pseudoruegeria sp. SK021 TaxID=1933035 RepID=UPI000A2449E8|nr:YihY/virulence factor BrkB family protein [Pseudoruegeria sp. SK021]OSP54806.1 ribonuclease BN [Pseudoruegeria sp. SK021]